jgi:hypothetical protein
LNNIDRGKEDDTTHDEDCGNCHGEEMLSNVETDSKRRTTQERKPLNKYTTVEELAA